MIDDMAIANDEDNHYMDALINKKAYDEMLSLLKTSDSPLLRNRSALELTDADIDITDTLVDLLGQERTKGHRGTLLYVLQEEIGADVPLSIITKIILEDDYESREEAIILLQHNQITATSEEIDEAYEKFFGRSLSDSDEDEVGARASAILMDIKRLGLEERKAKFRHWDATEKVLYDMLEHAMDDDLLSEHDEYLMNIFIENREYGLALETFLDIVKPIPERFIKQTEWLLQCLR